MQIIARPLLLAAGIAALGGCTTLSADHARDDAAVVLQLSHAEDRFNLAMREFAQRQVEENEQMKPLYGVIDNFWREQVRWSDVRDRVLDDYLRVYTPQELRAIRRTLESPRGDRVITYTDTLNRELAQQALAAVQDKLPALQEHLKSAHNALITGQSGELTPEQDYSAVKTRAIAGDAASQLLLAEKLLAGNGTARDIPQGVQWLEKAAAQDHPPAEDTLGSVYYRGVGVPRDYARARALFEKAVAHSYLPAVNNLAWLLATCPEASLRDGKRAVALLQPTMDRSVQMLDTLAAAQAETGNFAEALSLQRQSIAGIGNTEDPRMAVALDRLQSYANGKPWRDPAAK